MFISQKHLPRRTVLRGLGASLALPLLDGMVPAYAALRKTAANPVRRLGVCYVPNGMEMRAWTPAGEGREFELSQILPAAVPVPQAAQRADRPGRQGGRPRPARGSAITRGRPPRS